MPCNTQTHRIQPSAGFLRRITQIALLSLCYAFVQSATAQPLVAVSIKPLQHLVAALTQGVSAPVLILGSSQDPHNISLRPSERRSMADAALLVWIGPALELPLQDVLQQVQGKVLTIQNIEGLILLNTRNQTDPHLWLDTRNARLIALAVNAELQQLDPEHGQQYEENLQRFLQDLEQTHASIARQLTARPIAAWAVYHQAFAYFEAEFALPSALRLKDSDNVDAGVRSALAFSKAMQTQELACIVTEDGVNAATLRALLDNAQLRVSVADILGSNIEVSATSFNQLMLNVAQEISACSGAIHE